MLFEEILAHSRLLVKLTSPPNLVKVTYPHFFTTKLPKNILSQKFKNQEEVFSLIEKINEIEKKIVLKVKNFFPFKNVVIKNKSIYSHIETRGKFYTKEPTFLDILINPDVFLPNTLIFRESNRQAFLKEDLLTSELFFTSLFISPKSYFSGATEFRLSMSREGKLFFRDIVLHSLPIIGDHKRNFKIDYLPITLSEIESELLLKKIKKREEIYDIFEERLKSYFNEGNSPLSSTLSRSTQESTLSRSTKESSLSRSTKESTHFRIFTKEGTFVKIEVNTHSLNEKE